MELSGWSPLEVLHFPLRTSEQSAGKMRTPGRPGSEPPRRHCAREEVFDAGRTGRLLPSASSSTIALRRGLEDGWLVEDTRGSGMPPRPARRVRSLRRPAAGGPRWRFESPSFARMPRAPSNRSSWRSAQRGDWQRRATSSPSASTVSEPLRCTVRHLDEARDEAGRRPASRTSSTRRSPYHLMRASIW